MSSKTSLFISVTWVYSSSCKQRHLDVVPEELTCVSMLDRLLLRRHFLLLDAEQRGRIARGELTLQQRTVDDNVRLKSCFYAFNKMVDTCVLLARTLILDDWLQVIHRSCLSSLSCGISRVHFPLPVTAVSSSVLVDSAAT